MQLLSRKNYSGTVLVCTAILFFTSLAQQLTKPEPSATQEAVVRISTQLVQIDAIVTDKQGNHLENFSAEDFVLTVDGKPQPIEYLKLVRLVEPTHAESEIPTKDKSNTPVKMPPRRIEEQKVKRTIALVVDDLGLSFSSTLFAKDALKKFVAEQMQDGDLVAIIRTSGGFGIYQQFTNDKQILYAAIDRLKFALNGRKAIPFTLSSTSSLMGKNGVFETAAEKYHEHNKPGMPDLEVLDDPNQAAIRDSILQKKVTEASDKDVFTYRESIFTYGTLGALNQIVRTLRPLPGRKVAIVLSDGLPLDTARSGNNSGNTANSYIATAQRKILNLVELANRSSVAFYSINVQGLMAPTMDPNIESIDDPQRDQSFSGGSTFNDGMRTLAYETGGQAFFNNNNTGALLKKAVDDSRSYFLIGFDPDDEKFDRKQHKIKLTVKRSGLTVRTRNGFFGIEDSKAREIPKTREAQIVAALSSPFGARDIPYQVTSLFFSSTSGEPIIRSYFQIDCSKLKFKDEPDGTKSLALELVNFTFDENGGIIEKYAQSFTVSFNEAKYKQAMSEGLTYLNDFPIKSPGAYHFRSVLRDANSEQLGSSTQFIQVPDLGKDRLSLSGVILNAVLNPNISETANLIQANPAARRFAKDSEIEFLAAVYNLHADQQTKKARLRLQFELYHEGQRIFQSPERAVRTDRQTDPKWLECGGKFRLNNLASGEYLLRLMIKDELREGKSSLIEQWADFTVR
jgi:VWFA-related protein